MCVEHMDFDFTDNYITVFYGPNGAGKSTVFEAVALCWTERRRGDSYKDFIMHGSDTAEIHLTATVRGEPIQFDIELLDKKGLAPFQRTIKYKNGTYTNSECTALLASFDIDYLQHIMFSMQGENNITDLKPAERTKLLKRIFNFEFEQQISQLDSLIAQEEQNMLILKTRYDTMSHAKFDYEEEEKGLTAHEIKKKEDRIRAIDDTVRQSEQNQLLQAETVRRLESLRNQATAINTRKHSINVDIANLSNTRTRLLADKAQHQASLSNLPSTQTIETEIAEKTAAIDTLTRLIETNRQYIKEKAEQLSARQSSILELRNHIEAHKEGKCPKCGQTTHPESVPTLETRLQAISQEYATLQVQQTQLQADEKLTEKSITTNQVAIPNLREKIVSNAALRVQLENILKTLEESLRTTDETLAARQNTIKDLELQLQELENQIDEVSPKLVRVIDLHPLKNEKDTLTAELQAHLASIARNDVIRRKNQEMKVKEEENKKALADLNRQQNTLLTTINNYREAKRILEVDLPNYIIVKACSKLEKHINHFISEVKPGMVVRLFQARSGVEFFYSPNGVVSNIDDWTSTKMASGFERELLSAAWRVALAKAYNLEALMLDEVDSAANTVSSEKMFREIANLTGFDQLFIVSHKPEVVDILLQENERVTAFYVSEGTFTRQEY